MSPVSCSGKNQKAVRVNYVHPNTYGDVSSECNIKRMQAHIQALKDEKAIHKDRLRCTIEDIRECEAELELLLAIPKEKAPEA